jgi:hypothetical protein
VEQHTEHITQALAEQAETRDMLLSLVSSVMDACSCVTQIQRFKTSAQLDDRLKQLQPLVKDAFNFVDDYQSRLGGTGATMCARTDTVLTLHDRSEENQGLEEQA